MKTAISPRAAWSFEAIGTVWSIETDQPLGVDVREHVDRVVADFDREWSRFRDDSVVTRLSGGGTVPAPAMRWRCSTRSSSSTPRRGVP